MKFHRFGITVALLGTGLAAAGTATAAGAATATAAVRAPAHAGAAAATAGVRAPAQAGAAGSSWRTVPGPPVPAAINANLTAVAMTGPSQGWASGFTMATTRNAPFKALLGSWNGRTWRTVTLSLGASRLDGLATLSSRSAWAVGTAYPSATTAVPLIMHWNGSRWLRVPAANVPGYSYAALLGVAARSATDAWAVGEAESTRGVLRPLIERWNGHAWRLLANPPVPPMTAMTSVTVQPDGQAWLVGTPFKNSRSGVVLHWNGHAWAGVHTPATSTAVMLDGVTSSGTSIWAVGAAAGASGTLHPYALRWNGHTWTAMRVWPGNGTLEAITTTLDAVGNDGTGGLYASWTGSKWAVSTNAHIMQLNAITTDHMHRLWAVGSVNLGSNRFRPVVQVNG